MAQAIYQVDAFTDTPFAGNPAAVCPLDGPADEGWMGRLAAEMNLSETAFFWPEDTDRPAGGGYRLRWFTPATEVDLCGHATLAAAHILATELGAADGTIRFHTRSGELRVAPLAGGGYEMSFPALEFETQAPDDPRIDGLMEALGLSKSDVCHLVKSRFDLLVVLADARRVAALSPDFRALKEVPARGVIVTAASDDPTVDFVSRFFGPAVGVDEDPVTGSAHCLLGPWWGERLGRHELAGYQASARGGRVGLRLVDDRVCLRGDAVTVFAGELRISPDPP